MRYERLKRALDLSVAATGAVIMFVPSVIIAAAIVIDSKGSPIFRQIRIGKDGVPFVCYKFRTMTEDAPHERTKAQLENKDKYITRVGRFLRITSLDELPQLINVIEGSMSVVGPRPVIKEDSELIELRKTYGVYRVKPGITGLAQVCGRDGIGYHEKAMLDRFYAQYSCFRADVLICLYTVKKVLKREGIG